MKGLLLGLLVGLGLLLASAMVACAQPTPAPTPVPPPAPIPTPAPVLPEPANFAVSSLNVSPPKVGIDERVTISVIVTNTGGLSGSYIVTLNIDGLKAAAREVTLAGGASEKISFTTQKYAPRDYAVNVNGQSGKFTVRSPARFVISSISVLPGKVEPDEDVTISATVTNDGGSEGKYNVIFKVNGTEEFRKGVTLAAGVSQNVSYTLKKAVLGTYNVDINGTVVQFTVARRFIKDLAYIKAFGMPYSDDGGPNWKGISVSISYFNSNSEVIQFKDVSVNVTVALYWYTNSPPIYQKEVTVDSAEGIKWEVLKIPFDSVPKRPIGMSQYQKPILEVVVSTPTQGKFADRNAELQYWPGN